MYEKTFETLRVKHKLTLKSGLRVRDFITELQQLPANAQVDEVIGNIDSVVNAFSIEFHEKKEIDD